MMGNNWREGGRGKGVEMKGDTRGEADPKSREGAVLLLGARRTALRIVLELKRVNPNRQGSRS